MISTLQHTMHMVLGSSSSKYTSLLCEDDKLTIWATLPLMLSLRGTYKKSFHSIQHTIQALCQATSTSPRAWTQMFVFFIRDDIVAIVASKDIIVKGTPSHLIVLYFVLYKVGWQFICLKLNGRCFFSLCVSIVFLVADCQVRLARTHFLQSLNIVLLSFVIFLFLFFVPVYRYRVNKNLGMHFLYLYAKLINLKITNYGYPYPIKNQNVKI